MSDLLLLRAGDYLLLRSGDRLILRASASSVSSRKLTLLGVG